LYLQEGAVGVVADYCNHRLALWRLRDGSVWKHIGSEGQKPGQFTGPDAVAVTRQNALVVTDHHLVQVLTLDGAVLCELQGVGRLGKYLPGVAVCPNTDDILFTDYVNHRILASTWTAESGTVRISFALIFVFPV
jgi:hypothetical protein